jgi:hypothetical protein
MSKNIKRKTYTLIESKSIFKISLLVITLTILGVFFWGLGQHHTFFENSIISTTVLSVAFFLFITIGLYRGVKLKDNMGEINRGSLPSSDVADTIELSPNVVEGFDLDMGEGCAGVIVSIILWIVLAVLSALVLWIFSNVIIIMVMTFMAMLYWVFFRALRLVFKNSNKSKGSLIESIRYGLTYTLLYNFWIYGIFMLVEYFKNK